jgi:hypothetical protein
MLLGCTLLLLPCAMVMRRISDGEDSANVGSSDSPTAAVIPFLDPEDEVLAASATAAGAMAVVISPVGIVLLGHAQCASCSRM